MSPHFKRLEQLRYWKIGTDPTKLTGPLREPAAVIACMSAVIRARLDGADRARDFAREAYDVTQKLEYRDAALQKALLGVIPGQLIDGPREGRWMDAHNARPAYHYIMLAALAQLAAILPTDHPDRNAVIKSLTIGLKCRNSEILTQGVMTKDKAIECLLLVQSLFVQDGNFLKETATTPALDVVCRLASEQARRGRLPLGPRGWGEMLALLAFRDP